MKAACLLLALLVALPAAALETGAAGTPPASGVPLPFALGGPFRLIDQTGTERTEADPAGNLQLLFFGYASCENICTVALPQMAGIAEGLAARGVPVTPVMITVDPARDTPEAMARALGKLDPRFVGLTGSDDALANAWRAFGIDRSVVFTDPAGGAVYAHGSLLYLLDGKGRFLTVIPPILSDARVMDIIAAFAAKG